MRNTIVPLMDFQAASPNDVHRYEGYFAIRNIFVVKQAVRIKFYPAEDPESFVYFQINEMFSGGLSDEFHQLKPEIYELPKIQMESKAFMILTKMMNKL